MITRVCSRIFIFLLQPIAYLFLIVTGWQPITKFFIEEFHRHPRKVVIFPHTSKWDFIILMAYAITEWSIYRSGVYVVMKPQLVNGPFGWFFRACNCLAATRREDKGGGFIEAVTKRFKKKETFTILISPEGTIDKAEWKTGYFYLAQSLDCSIHVMGLDYYDHQLVAGKSYNPVNIIETQKNLKSEISLIAPLYPKNSIVATYPPGMTGLFDWQQVATIIFITIFILECYFTSL